MAVGARALPTSEPAAYLSRALARRASGCVAFPFWGNALDTAAQAGLLALAWRAKKVVEDAPPSRERLTGASAPRVGWTFALTAGVLPPLVMAALAPTLHLGCFSAPAPARGLEGAWLVCAAVLSILGLRLIARMRTAGLLVVIVTAVAGAAIITERLATDWYRWAAWGLHAEHYLALMGHAFLLAALIPLGPRLAGVLVGRRPRR